MSWRSRLEDAMRRHGQMVHQRSSFNAVMQVNGYDPQTHCVKGILQPWGIQSGWVPLATPQPGMQFGFHAPPLNNTIVNVHFPRGVMGGGGFVTHAHFNDQFQPVNSVVQGEFHYQSQRGTLLKHADDGSVKHLDKAGNHVFLDGQGKIIIGPQNGTMERVATRQGLSANVWVVYQGGGTNQNPGANGGVAGGQGGDPLPVIGGGTGQNNFSPGLVFANGTNPFNGIAGMLGGMLAIGQDDGQGNPTQPVAAALSKDGSLSSTGALTVSSTNGVPFAPSATTDTTNAANISNVYGVLLNTITVSGAPSTVSDLTSLTTGYTAYEIRFINLLPTTNNVTLGLQVHANGAFQGTNYWTSVQAIGNGSSSIANPSTLIQLSSLVPNVSSGISGHIRVYNPANTTVPKTWTGQTGHPISATPTWETVIYAGAWNGANAVDGFQLFFSGSTMASGQVQVIGLH